MIVAFADTGQGYHGGIYQASGFVYAGLSEKGRLFKHKATGRILHNRAVLANGYRSHFGCIRKVPRTDECTIIVSTEKHRYLLPLTAEMKIIVEKFKKPCPKRAVSKEALRLDTIQEGAVRI